MDAALKELFNQIKITGIINGDSLERIYSMILSRCDKSIAQKKAQIERAYGEITQLEATRSILLMVLRDYMSDIKQNIADQKLTEELMAKRKTEAEERLKKALESEGREPVATQTVTEEATPEEPTPDLIASKEEEAKKQKRARKI